jgi:cytidylate kinase
MGDLIGPAVADRLNLQFYDLAIPIAVARCLNVDIDSALALDQVAPGRIDRILESFANSGNWVNFGPSAEVESLSRYQKQTEQTLLEIAAGEGGVVLGRAANIVLRDHAPLLRVRLDAPERERIAISMKSRNLDFKTASDELRNIDRVRNLYVRRYYGLNPKDPLQYDLVLDSTRFSFQVCLDLILAASKHQVSVGWK